MDAFSAHREPVGIAESEIGISDQRINHGYRSRSRDAASWIFSRRGSEARRKQKQPTDEDLIPAGVLMCPVCLTTTAFVAAGGVSAAGVLGLVAVKFQWLRRFRRRTVSQPE